MIRVLGFIKFLQNYFLLLILYLLETLIRSPITFLMINNIVNIQILWRLLLFYFFFQWLKLLSRRNCILQLVIRQLALVVAGHYKVWIPCDLGNHSVLSFRWIYLKLLNVVFQINWNVNPISLFLYLLLCFWPFCVVYHRRQTLFL